MKDCIFCKIVKGEIPCKKIYEDEDILAFHDIDPRAPVHFLVIPKKHISNIMEAEAVDSALFGKILFKAQELAKEPGLASPAGCGEKGGRFVINCKSQGGQSVDHLHLHFLGGRSMAWPPG